MNLPSNSSPYTSVSSLKNLLIPEESKSSTAELVTTNSMIYCYKPGHYHNKMSIPFEPRWAFGVEIHTRVVNLTKEKLKCRIFYAAAHVGVVYDDMEKEKKFFMGHKNKIISTSSNLTGKYLVTADSLENHSIVIWDSDQCIPVHTIFDPHPDVGTELVSMSGDAKYLVTIGKEDEPKIKFWMWTYGNQKEDDSLTLKRNYGDLQNISFSPNESRHFMVTFTEFILFFTWANNTLERWIPGTRKTKSVGAFQTSTYIEDSHECITVTNTGWIIIWGISFFNVPFNSMPLNNNKILIKKIRLQKHAITCLVAVDGIIVTGDVVGHIKFYDKTMKILYWYQAFSLDGIIAIEFNLSKKKIKAEAEAQSYADGTASKKKYIRSFNDIDDDDRSDEYEKIYADLLPSDYSLLREPFYVRDFIVVTAKGRVSYVDFLENKIYPSFSTQYVAITSLAVHDSKPLICIGYLNGVITQFNYVENKITFEETIMNSKEEDYNEITSIAYSTHGWYLACSTGGGHLWFLEPSILKPIVKKPFIYDHSRITQIHFSSDNKYIAYFDSSMAVCLLKRSDNKTQGFPDWIFHGRYIAHYKQIADLLFCRSSRLFSISHDRCLVEYDVERSEAGKLELISRTTVMQTGIPTSFMCYYLENQLDDSLFFLISTSEFKYYIVNVKGGSLEKTILAPTLGNPVKRLKSIPGISPNHMLFCNNNYLGIQLLKITGNPFKRVAMIVHPTALRSFRISNCGNYVFTFGENDNICIKWEIKFESVTYMNEIGGSELNPYYCLIEGGVNGWLFKEMKDLFYYMQILHDGEDSSLPRKTYEKIATCELPNLLRSIGFFPSEYELDNILYEVKYYYATLNEVGEEEISFENFVKLYINHRPVGKYHLDEVNWAFNNFATSGTISRDEFVRILVSKGEPFDYPSLHHCLTILLSINKEEESALSKTSFNILPNVVTYDTFVNDILGINIKTEEI